MRMRWFLLALRLALPVTVPAAVPCTHLAMHHFLLQILGVAVMRMRWFLPALRLVLPVTVPAALVGTHLTMHDFLLPNFGVAVIRMGDWWVLLALGLLLPLSVPAALSCTHLTMPNFSVPDRGVAVIRMRWLVIRLLRADMGVRVPSAEFLLGDTGVTSLALQSESSAAWLWLLLRTSRKWSGMEGQWIRWIDDPGSADFLHRYTSLTCLTLCTDGIATKFLRFWKCNGPCRSCWSHKNNKKHQSRCNQSSKLHGVFVFDEVLLLLLLLICVCVFSLVFYLCLCRVCWSTRC